MILRQQLVCIGVATLLCSLISFSAVGVDAAVGVNYGTVANDLPSPADVVALLKTTIITRVKLYNADPTILSAFAGSGLSLIVGVTNDQIYTLGRSPSFAQQWVSTNIAAFVPSTDIVAIAVGNEVLSTSPTLRASLVPAMQNLHTGLVNLGLADRIKVSTPHSYGVLTKSYPPKQGAFRADLAEHVFAPMLDFLAQTGAPFMINAYPYFAYRQDTKLSIAYALFEPNAGVTDPATGLHYDNMFDAQVDAVYAAMAKLGHQDVTIVVSETGWPSLGDSDEAGVGINNAQTYNGNLLKHLASVTGTPSRPGVVIDTYIFSLFNENQKPGPSSERNFGLFLPNRNTVYNVGIQTGLAPPSPPGNFTSPPPPPAGNFTSPPPPPAGNFTSPPPPPAGNFTSPPPPPAPAAAPPPNATAHPPPPPVPIAHPPPPPALPTSPSPPPPFSIPPPPPFTTPPSPSPPPPTAPAPIQSSPPPAPPTPSPPEAAPGPPGSRKHTWCVAKPGSGQVDLQNALNFACGEGGADCSAIQSGGPCFEPNALFSHASYAFNSYYSKNGRNYWNCYFGNSSLITITNPSYSACLYT